MSIVAGFFARWWRRWTSGAERRNHIDIVILLSATGLMAFSVIVVYSASSSWALLKHGSADAVLLGHSLKIAAAFGALILFSRLDYHRLARVSKPVLLGAILLLAGTLVLGGEVKGASRWLRLGGLSLQPSEIAKYALILHLAVLLATRRDRLEDFKTGFLPLLVWVGVVVGLVLLQPNFSTGAMIAAVSVVLLFVGQARLRHMALAVGGLVPLLLVYMMSAEYRMRRIIGFLTGDGDAGSSATYQMRQGIMSFGIGGITGVGPGESRQRDFFLPESFGDFVFSIVGEEYGLIGTLAVMGVFCMIMVRGLRIARNAPDELGRYLAAGITSSVTLYALVNAGVTLGILPTTGLPMPFVSYGGSSMVFSAAALGVLLSISAHTDMYPRLTQAPDGVRPLEPVSAARGA
jgi:cell division protein FtsW